MENATIDQIFKRISSLSTFNVYQIEFKIKKHIALISPSELSIIENLPKKYFKVWMGGMIIDLIIDIDSINS